MDGKETSTNDPFRDGQEGGRETHGGVDARRAFCNRKEGCNGQMEKDETEKEIIHAIYILMNEAREIIYVGQTVDGPSRLAKHRERLGVQIKMRIIQNVYFNSETPDDAERKWIRHYKALGARLLNRILVFEQDQSLNASPAAQLGRLGGITCGIKKGLSAMSAERAAEIRAMGLAARRNKAQAAKRRRSGARSTS